jgi:hypothetical protein
MRGGAARRGDQEMVAPSMPREPVVATAVMRSATEAGNASRLRGSALSASTVAVPDVVIAKNPFPLLNRNRDASGDQKQSV